MAGILAPPASSLANTLSSLAEACGSLAEASSSLALKEWRAICSSSRTVTDQKLIGVHHLRSDGREIAVLLFRNGPSSVAAQCLIHPGDTPIVDGPTPEAVLALLACVLDDLLLARGSRPAAPS